MGLRRTGSKKPSMPPKRPGKVFDFKEQLTKGNAAEEEFPAIYKQMTGLEVEKHTTFDYDFNCEDGNKVELKTDFYPHEKTANFFIERWSDYDAEKPGSLWQSGPKGVTQFIYWYKSSGKVYKFTIDLEKLAGIIEQLVEEKSIPMKFIQNRTYRGGGWCIPRKLLADYWEVFEV